MKELLFPWLIFHCPGCWTIFSIVLRTWIPFSLLAIISIYVFRCQRSEGELKDSAAARRVQKADREKLRRDRLNEHFVELGNILGEIQRISYVHVAVFLFLPSFTLPTLIFSLDILFLLILFCVQHGHMSHILERHIYFWVDIFVLCCILLMCFSPLWFIIKC